MSLWCKDAIIDKLYERAFFDDELTLGIVSDEERDYMHDKSAKDPRMKCNVYLDDRNADSSDGSLSQPPIMDSVHRYLSINVKSQQAQLSSLLNFRKKNVRNYKDEKTLCILKLSKKYEFVEFDLGKCNDSSLIGGFDKNIFSKADGKKYVFTMPSHSFSQFEMLGEVNVD